MNRYSLGVLSFFIFFLFNIQGFLKASSQKENFLANMEEVPPGTKDFQIEINNIFSLPFDYHNSDPDSFSRTYDVLSFEQDSYIKNRIPIILNDIKEKVDNLGTTEDIANDLDKLTLDLCKEIVYKVISLARIKYYVSRDLGIYDWNSKYKSDFEEYNSTIQEILGTKVIKYKDTDKSLAFLIKNKVNSSLIENNFQIALDILNNFQDLPGLPIEKNLKWP